MRNPEFFEWFSILAKGGTDDETITYEIPTNLTQKEVTDFVYSGEYTDVIRIIKHTHEGKVITSSDISKEVAEAVAHRWCYDDDCRGGDHFEDFISDYTDVDSWRDQAESDRRNDRAYREEVTFRWNNR